MYVIDIIEKDISPHMRACVSMSRGDTSHNSVIITSKAQSRCVTDGWCCRLLNPLEVPLRGTDGISICREGYPHTNYYYYYKMGDIAYCLLAGYDYR